MNVIKMMLPYSRLMELDLDIDTIAEVIGQNPVLLYEGQRYGVFCSLAAQLEKKHINYAASELAGEEIYGYALIIGLEGERMKTWCDVSIEVIDRVKEAYRKSRRIKT